MAAKEIPKLRKQLQELKTEYSAIQGLYREKANQRVAYQNKMAELNCMVQASSTDIMLIEDIVVVTLVAENDALHRFALMPPEPTKTAIEVQPGQKTKNAEEACTIYKSQIEVLEERKDYTRVLAGTERDMDLIYRQAIDDILDIMDEYCSDERLIEDLELFATSGDAPCSPRKKTKKGGIGRILNAPGLLFSPKKSPRTMKSSSDKDDDLSPVDRRLPQPTSVEPSSTPKQGFDQFVRSTTLQAPPLFDLSDSDHEGEVANRAAEEEDEEQNAGEEEDLEEVTSANEAAEEENKDKIPSRVVQYDLSDSEPEDGDAKPEAVPTENIEDTPIIQEKSSKRKKKKKEEALPVDESLDAPIPPKEKKSKKKKSKKHEAKDEEEVEEPPALGPELQDIPDPESKKKKSKKKKSKDDIPDLRDEEPLDEGLAPTAEDSDVKKTKKSKKKFQADEAEADIEDATEKTKKKKKKKKDKGED